MDKAEEVEERQEKTLAVWSGLEEPEVIKTKPLAVKHLSSHILSR